MSVIIYMLGKWRLETRDNNFEQFLSCREVGWFLRKLMTSTTVDTEYKLNEDKTTFTKVYMMVNSQRRLAFENLLSHGCEWFGVYNIF